LLLQCDAEADEMLGLWILPVGAGDPFDGMVVLSRLQAQEAHQLQAVDMERIDRKGLLAAQLCVEMAPRLHVLEAKCMERSRCRPVVARGCLVGLAGDGPAFTTVHIGAFELLVEGRE
jgi:hypothetical protein